jgi:hypothetical protein
MAACVDIFFVCMASIAFEIFLTRLFAVTCWSEYGYWIISIAMVGYAASGVLICLAGERMARRARDILPLLVLGLLAYTPAAFHLVNLVDFNPLELQNAVLWPDQLLNIGRYYLALFPFFLLCGCFVGLAFIAGRDHITAVYTADLVGAGLGSLAMLAAMHLLHPFHLLVLVPPMLFCALAAGLPKSRLPGRPWLLLLGALLLAGGEWWLVACNNATPSAFKPLFASVNAPGSREVLRILSPRGLYQVMESPLERLDVDLSHNYATLGTNGPPRALGVYRDGERKAALPTGAPEDATVDYVGASLDNLPYLLRTPKDVLLVGSKGGFRIREVKELGAQRVTALEPEPELLELARERLGLLLQEPDGHPRNILVIREPDQGRRYALHPDAEELLVGAAPFAQFAEDRGTRSIIDASSEYIDGSPTGRYLFTTEAMVQALEALEPRGILSLSVNIGEFTVYAVKVVATLIDALRDMGIDRPEDHVIVYRNAWRARILASPSPFDRRDAEVTMAFCNERSFDVSFVPGVPLDGLPVWNDLPPVSFLAETTADGEAPRDALREDIQHLAQHGDVAEPFFDLAPGTLDRPFFHNILPLGRPLALLDRIDIIPRPEINGLVNVLVLLQATLFALLILPLPLLKKGTVTAPPGRFLKDVLYFICLGLGFLFVEITLIERFSFLLGDNVMAFSLVLASMLIASGLGSARAGKFADSPDRGMRLAAGVTAGLLCCLVFLLPQIVLATLDWSLPARCLLAAACSGVPAFFMGFSFPLGLSAIRGNPAFLPWAWSINGAMSVVATPLASLAANAQGYTLVLASASVLYIIAALVCPTPDVTSGGSTNKKS